MEECLPLKHFHLLGHLQGDRLRTQNELLVPRLLIFLPWVLLFLPWVLQGARLLILLLHFPLLQHHLLEGGSLVLWVMEVVVVLRLCEGSSLFTFVPDHALPLRAAVLTL